MEGRHDVRIELSYDDGLRAKVMATQGLPAVLEPAMERFSTVEWLPAVETLPLLLDSFEAAAVIPHLSLEAEALKGVAAALVAQDDAISRWVAGEQGPELTRVRAALRPHQVQGAAFLAFRGRGLLADPRPLDPTTTAVAACEIVRARKPGARVVIVSPESRHADWQREIERLSGELATPVAGARNRRREIFGERSAYLLLSHDDLPKERQDLEAYAPDVLVVDEVSRIWELGSRHLDTLRRLKSEWLFLVAPVDAVKYPEELHGVLSLLSPVLAGPRQAWEARYVDRSVKGQRRVRHEGELQGRVAPFVLRRGVDAEGAQGGMVREVRRVALGKAQQAVYDRAARTLLSLLSRDVLKLPEQRRAEDLLATMREVCDSMSLRHEAQDESSKLEELRFLIEEEAISGRKIVIFSRWEAMTRQISDMLKQRRISHVRHYRKLPIKRREGLLERFRDESEAQVLVTSDTDLLVSPLRADVLIHFDAPWEPGVVTWRRAQVQGAAIEEVALVGAGTLEDELWQLPKPATVDPRLSIEEEEEGVSGVHLFGRQSSNLLRLKQLMGLEPVPTRGEEVEENPAMASVIAAVLEAHHQEATEMMEAELAHVEVAVALSAPELAAIAGGMAADGSAAGGRGAMDAREAEAAARVEPMSAGIEIAVTVMADHASAGMADQASAGLAAAMSAGTSEMAAPEMPGMAASEAPGMAASEAPGMAASFGMHGAGAAMPGAMDGGEHASTSAGMGEAAGADMSASMAGGDEKSARGDSGSRGGDEPDRPSWSGSEPEMAPGGPVEQMLERVEIPLKALNRIVAGVPVVGQPISMVNGVLWEMVTSRLRSR